MHAGPATMMMVMVMMLIIMIVCTVTNEARRKTHSTARMQYVVWFCSLAWWNDAAQTDNSTAQHAIAQRQRLRFQCMHAVVYVGRCVCRCRVDIKPNHFHSSTNRCRLSARHHG